VDQTKKPSELATPRVGNDDSVTLGADNHRNKSRAVKRQEPDFDFEALARKAEPPEPLEPKGEDPDEFTGEECILITPEPITDRCAQSSDRPAAPRPGGLYKVNILVSSVEGYPCERRAILTSREGISAITRAAKAHGVEHSRLRSRNPRGRASA
jgi:hypothetical protein